METKQYLTHIKNHISGINSILEIQCGDKYDIENCSSLKDPNLKYFGVDVDDDIIRDNRQFFREEKNKIFITLDASNEPLPKSDLVSCVGMAPYLPIPNIWSLLEQIRESQADYFLFDHYVSAIGDESTNSQIEIKHNQKSVKRAVNLCLAPFYFPNPAGSLKISEEHHIALFEISKVGFFMDLQSDRFSLLRRNIFNVLEESFQMLENAFLKEPDGERIFKNLMLGFLNLSDIDHEKLYFFDALYSSILSKSESVLESRNSFFRLVYSHSIDYISKQFEIHCDDITIKNSQIIAKDYIRWKLNSSFFF